MNSMTDEYPKYEKSERERVFSDLILACEAALQLHGIAASIRDPLALLAEKETYRARYLEIEEQIKAAIARGKELK